MKEFIEERMLADKADPFTKVRLVKLAERYDEQLGLGSGLHVTAKYRLAFPG
jgi:hypothetical protein